MLIVFVPASLHANHTWEHAELSRQIERLLGRHIAPVISSDPAHSAS